MFARMAPASTPQQGWHSNFLSCWLSPGFSRRLQHSEPAITTLLPSFRRKELATLRCEIRTAARRSGPYCRFTRQLESLPGNEESFLGPKTPRGYYSRSDFLFPPGSILGVKIPSLDQSSRLPDQSRFGTAGRKFIPLYGRTGRHETSAQAVQEPFSGRLSEKSCTNPAGLGMAAGDEH